MKAIPSIIGRSKAIDGIRSLIQSVARSASTVLILGESGTGKELVARALHDLSDRSGAAFVPVNCAAIPKELIESELFGHRKGAFTGALNDRVGRFELAHGGTLFLDEIGDLSLDMQVKLLRVLQERAVDPIGSQRSVSIDVRIVAATHRDIEGEIASGHFRQDLFYRLNVLPIEMPTLRDRLDDIPDLSEAFARRHAPAGRAPVIIENDLMHAMQCYDWPGNVRELSNLIDRFSVLYPSRRLSLQAVPPKMLPRGMRPVAEQMLALAEQASASETQTSGDAAIVGGQSSGSDNADGPDWLNPVDAGYPSESAASTGTAAPTLGASLTHDETDAAHPFAVPPRPRSVEEIVMMVQDTEDLPEEGLHLKQHLAEIERSLIRQALERSAGNISQTARLLRLQRTTLIEKINKYDLKSLPDEG